MNRHTETNVWHRPESYVPEARPIAWNDVLFGAACGLLFGMLGTVGLAYVIAWVAL